MCNACKRQSAFLSSRAEDLRLKIQRIENILPHLIQGYEEHIKLKEKYQNELNQIEGDIFTLTSRDKVSILDIKEERFASHEQSSAASAYGAPPLRSGPSGAACGLS